MYDPWKWFKGKQNGITMDQIKEVWWITLIADMTQYGSDGWSGPYEAKSWRFLNIENHDIENRNSSWAAGCLTIAVGGPWLRGSLMVSFLLGRNLVIPKDELRYILCIRMSTFPCGIRSSLGGRDRHIILVLGRQNGGLGNHLTFDTLWECDRAFKIRVVRDRYSLRASYPREE